MDLRVYRVDNVCTFVLFSSANPGVSVSGG